MDDQLKSEYLISYAIIINSTSEIMKFIRNFRVIKGENKYINITSSSDFIKDLEIMTNLPLTNYYLTERQIKRKRQIK